MKRSLSSTRPRVRRPSLLDPLEQRRMLAGASYTTNGAGLPLLTSTPPNADYVTIYLDFDGYTPGGGGKNYIPFDIDGNTASFNATEQAHIYDTWRSIVSYFSPFAVQVTTDPAVALPATNNTAWMIISDSTNTTSAYTYFGNVPTGWSADSNAISRHSAIAHEIGHMFGLLHQSAFDEWGVLDSEYLNGYNNTHGALSGSDFALPLTKWYFGFREGSNLPHIQDDLAKITDTIVTKLGTGTGYRTDDHSGSVATALTLTNGTTHIDGIIETLTDIDYFKMNGGAGRYAISILPTYESGLAPKLEVLNSSGTLIATLDTTGYRNQGGKDWIDNSQEVTMDLPSGDVFFKVHSHGGYADLGEYRLIASKLPDTDWNSADISVLGGTGKGGFTTYNSSTSAMTVGASGEGESDNNAGHRMVYKLLDGNGSITARVTNFENFQELGLRTLAKAGLEIRESLEAKTKSAHVYFRSDGVTSFYRRSTDGVDPVYYTNNNSYGIGNWLRLTRNNSTITASASTDGVTFTNLYTATISMNQQVYIGLAQHADTMGDLSIATYDNIAFSGTVGTPAPTYNALTPPTLSTVLRPSGTGTGFNVDWFSTPGATGYRVERSIDGVNFTPVAETGSGTTVYLDDSGYGVMRHWYRVSAKTSDGLFSAPSNILAWSNRPTAVNQSTMRVLKYSDTKLFVEWFDVAGDQGYRLERSSDGGSTFPFSVDLPQNVRIYHDDNSGAGLTAGTEYVYRVRPLHSSFGNGAWSTVTGGTRWDAPTNLAISSVASTSIQLTWSDVATDTGYVIRRSSTGAGNDFVDIGSVSANVTTFTDNTVTAHKEYYYQVQALKGANQLARSFSASAAHNAAKKLVFAATPATTSLPTGFSVVDLGNNTNHPGSTHHNAGALSLISGGGSSISAGSDNIHFLYKEITGDATVVAKVKRMEVTGTYAKAGVMIRDSLNANATAGQTAVYSGGLEYGRRYTAGNTGFYTYDTENFDFRYDLDVWVKLERVGSTFTSSWSATGAPGTWTVIDIPRTINMTGSVFVGIALASNNDERMSTTTFSDLSIT